MQELPLHPVLVHFPLVLGALLPAIIVMIRLGIRTKYFAEATWFLVPLALLVTLGSGYAAMRAGGQDEEIVERMVSEDAIEFHEERAKEFMYAAAGLFLISLVPLRLKSRQRAMVEMLVFAGSIGVMYLALQAGHTGGALVYQLDAPAAHIRSKLTPSTPQIPENSEKHDDDDSDH